MYTANDINYMYDQYYNELLTHVIVGVYIPRLLPKSKPLTVLRGNGRRYM